MPGGRPVQLPTGAPVPLPFAAPENERRRNACYLHGARQTHPRTTAAVRRVDKAFDAYKGAFLPAYPTRDKGRLRGRVRSLTNIKKAGTPWSMPHMQQHRTHAMGLRGILGGVGWDCARGSHLGVSDPLIIRTATPLRGPARGGSESLCGSAWFGSVWKPFTMPFAENWA